MAFSDPEKQKEWQREWRRKNPEKLRIYQERRAKRYNRAARNAATKKWRELNPDRVRLINLRRALRSYGLTLEDYERMWVAQRGLCAICGNPESARGAQTNGKFRRLCVDHSHTTNKIRALLCSRCNTAIGSLFEDPELLRKAAAYLEQFE